jgi:hypothetical protein
LKVILSQLPPIVKRHPFNPPCTANVKRITQNIGFRGVVSIDKIILLPLLWSRRQFISENIGGKGIAPAESGEHHEDRVGYS